METTILILVMIVWQHSGKLLYEHIENRVISVVILRNRYGVCYKFRCLHDTFKLLLTLGDILHLFLHILR